MKTALKLMLLLLCCNIALGQNNLSIKAQVDSIRYLKGDAAFGCNSVIWRIIAKKKEAVPYLIGLIADSTSLPVYYKCKGMNCMKVGDMAFYVLNTIVHVPMTFVAKQQFDLYQGGCQVGVYEHIDKHRLLFQKQVQNWYTLYKDKLAWQRYGERTKSSGCVAIDNITGNYAMVYEDPKPVPEKKEAKQKKSNKTMMYSHSSF